MRTCSLSARERAGGEPSRWLTSSFWGRRCPGRVGAHSAPVRGGSLANLVWANRAYIARASKEILMCYVHTMFGLFPDSPLPSHDNGELRVMLANEYERRGRPVCTEKLGMEDIWSRPLGRFSAPAFPMSSSLRVVFTYCWVQVLSQGANQNKCLCSVVIKTGLKGLC